jgi:hypothetical protein
LIWPALRSSTIFFSSSFKYHSVVSLRMSYTTSFGLNDVSNAVVKDYIGDRLDIVLEISNTISRRSPIQYQSPSTT